MYPSGLPEISLGLSQEWLSWNLNLMLTTGEDGLNRYIKWLESQVSSGHRGNGVDDEGL